MKADIPMVNLGVDLAAVVEADLIDIIAAAKLVRGRKGSHVNRDVMRRYASPRRGRVFVIDGKPCRLVLPTVARGCSRLTTVAWVELWKRKYAELADLARDSKPS